MSSMIRGIEAQHEHTAQMVARDTRPLGLRAAEFLCSPAVNLTIYFGAVIICWLIPHAVDIVFLLCIGICMFAFTRKHALPFKLPESSLTLDYNEIMPGANTVEHAKGISFFGNERGTGEELWFSNSDMRTHVLIFGSTGSGKTEALISLAYNALIQGSGFIYVDGKGDNSLFAKVFSMVRSMGREDDLLTINFMTGARDILGPQASRLSNTMNPFANGSSSMLSQLVVSLMDSSSSDASGDMWKGRAINFVESLMKILTVMRDEGHILLDANTIRDYFLLEKLESIVVGKKFPIGNTGVTVALDQYPAQILDPLRNYVLNLPGYNPTKRGNQSGEVLEQHGFITMQLTRVFGSLSDTYGHILRTNLAEVDLKDVVLNRRILLVLLPALEKSPEELANLGKVIIASLKAMMAAGLGDTLEGDYRDVIARKPTNSAAPFMCIMDEYGYYAVKGFAVVAAQARSLGFSAIFAGQDLPAFQKASKEEAASIGANCNIKICMKLEDPQETWEFFNKSAGESYVTNVSGFQLNSGSLSVNYMDNRNASVDRRQRIELLDLKDQREGQAHIFFKSKIVRADMFYANPKITHSLKLNHFLKVGSPPVDEVLALSQRINKLQAVFLQYSVRLPDVLPNEDIMVIQRALDEANGLYPHERGVMALIAVLEHELTAHKQLAETLDSTLLDTQMSIFSPIPVTAHVQKMIGEKNLKPFSKPLLDAEEFLKNLISVERISGRTELVAKNLIKDLFVSLEQVTSFPQRKAKIPVFSKEQLLSDLNRILSLLGGRPFTPPMQSTKLSPMLELPDLPDLDHVDDFNNLDLDGLLLHDLPELQDLAELERIEKALRDGFNLEQPPQDVPPKDNDDSTQDE